MSVESIQDIYLKDLTEDQRAAVLTNGEVIVSAAAGSGKTKAMIFRVMRLLAESALQKDQKKRISLKNMLILVYNNAAADELREKLYTKLYEAAYTTTGEVQEFFKIQIDELSFAHISTIHAYCQSLIKDNFNYLGISPDFEVLDEDQHKEYMYQALENVFDEYDKQDDEAFEKMVQVFAQKRKEDNFKDNVIKLFQVVDVQPDPQKFYDNISECYADYDNSKFLSIIFDFEHDFFSKAKETLEPCVEVFQTVPADSKSMTNYRDKVVNAFYTAKKMAESTCFEEMLSAAIDFKDINARKYAWDAIYAEHADIAKPCIDDMKEELDKLKELAKKGDTALRTAHSSSGRLISKFVEITKRFGEELERLKRADNVLAFEDLQHKAVELLSTGSIPVQKFQQVLVDEYQDVNPTQEEIISKLLDGKCLMVGDTKQSIYGFRLADPTNFSNRQDRYERGEGTAIYFKRNFRSGRKILEFVNEIFERVMVDGVADVDYDENAKFDLSEVKEEGLVEMDVFSCDSTPKTTVSGVYDITKDEGKEKNLTAADLEGIFIANKIRELVNNAKKEDGYISYGDITILTRNRSTNAQRIVAKLKEAGIPVDDSGFERTKEAPETELIQFLRVIDNPRQDIPFAGFLLSFFGGYKEQELADIAEIEAPTFYDKFVIYSTINDDALAEKIKGTKSLLEKYRIKASFKNVRDLASGIISDFSYDAYLGKNGEAVVYGLKAFVAGIIDADNESLGRFLRNYGESESKKTASSNGDRVHLSTFHGYKGIENEVVFVSDLDASFNKSDVKGDFIVDSKGYVAMNYFDFDNATKSDKTISRFATKILYGKKTLAEEMRLLYVALTRAKRFMYVTSSISNDKLKSFAKVKGIKAPNSMLEIIGDAICEGADIQWTLHRNSEFEGYGAKKPVYVFPAANKTLQKEIEKAQAFEYPFKPATTLAIKYSVSALDSLDEQTVSAYAEGDFKNVGTIYHKVMQYIDFLKRGVDGVKEELVRLVNEKYLTQEELDEVRDAEKGEFEKNIARCLDSKIMSYALQAEKQGRCQREKAFMMYQPANKVRDDFVTDEKVLVQGVIDLFIDGDEKIIVDFKHSALRDEETLKKYQKQLNLYKLAVERAINAKVDKILLYSFNTGKTINAEDFSVFE